MNNLDEGVVCAALERGISGESYEVVKNVCEDYGVEVVDKDYMSIVLDVYDQPVVDAAPVKTNIFTEDLRLEVIGTGEDSVLVGVIEVGESANQINQMISDMRNLYGKDLEEEAEDKLFEEEDVYTFVIAEGDIDPVDVSKIEGMLNTVIKDEALVFNEGDIVNMPLKRFEKYHLL